MKGTSRTLAVLTAATLAASGCTSSETGETEEAASAEPFSVSYSTAFGTNGRDAFAWVAEELGLFEEAGLDVEINAGAGTTPNLASMEEGEVDFTSLDMTGAIIEAGTGAATNFKVIAAIHQRTLVAIITLEGNGITAAQDLEGIRLGAATATVNQLLFPAYAAVAGIDDTQVEWVETAPPDLPGLLADDEADALSTFLIGGRGIELAAGGTPAVVLPYSEFLTDLFGNGIMASTEMVEEHPDVVIRFRDAMLEALEWSIENPEESAQILTDAVPDSAGVEAAVAEIEAMTPAVLATGEIGVIDEVQVARAIGLMQGADLIPSGLAPEDLVAFDLVR